MANNYLTFSFTLTFPNEATCDLAYAYYNGPDFAKRIEQLDGEGADTPCFECTKEGPAELWIRSEEYGDVNHVAEFLEEVSRSLLNHERIGFQWACTCSKLRVGEFGGGAMWTDGRDSHWHSTYQFLDEARIINAA